MFKKLLVAIFILMVSSGPAFSREASISSIVDPSDVGIGARPLGMGKAYVGMSNDGSGLFVNPAGLAGATSPKIVSMGGQIVGDANYYVIGGAVPSDIGTIGFGYVNVGVSDIPVTVVDYAGTPSAEVNPIGSTDYYSSVAVLSYSSQLSKIDWFKDQKDVSYGINFKYFMQGFIGGGEYTKDGNGTGYDMDFGLQYKASKSTTYGLSVLNFLPESSGGKFIWAKDNVTESIPAMIKPGVSMKVFGPDSYFGGKQNLFVGFDADMSPILNRQTVYHAGLEWWPVSVLALRFGVDQKPKGTEDEIGIDNNLTAGIGLKHKGFTFDYCYHQFSDLNENVSHFFSIGYVGEDPVTTKEPEEKIKGIIPIIVPSASLESFEDVPPGYWAKSPIEFMATLHIMNGYYDKKFRPEDTVTRAELASMLINLKNVEVNDVNSDPFPDVNKDYWAAKYIKAAAYLNLMTTYPDGQFKPDNKITRAEGVVILSRFTDAPEPKTITKNPFVDIPKNHWAVYQITAAQDYGLLDYLIGRQFDPNKELTRAEIAEMLSKTTFGKEKIRRLLNAYLRNLASK
jgi:hypothetical protein